LHPAVKSIALRQQSQLITRYLAATYDTDEVIITGRIYAGNLYLCGTVNGLTVQSTPDFLFQHCLVTG